MDISYNKLSMIQQNSQNEMTLFIKGAFGRANIIQVSDIQALSSTNGGAFHVGIEVVEGKYSFGSDGIEASSPRRDGLSHAWTQRMKPNRLFTRNTSSSSKNDSAFRLIILTDYRNYTLRY